MAQVSMDSVKEIAVQVDQEFKKEFGRGYGIIESVMLEDAEVVIVTAGSNYKHGKAGHKRSSKTRE